MLDKHNEMLCFWTDRVRRYGTDPKSNTNDRWLREVEISSVQKVLDRYRPRRVLDFGCANGYTTRRLAEAYPDILFVGVDLNENMITAAKEVSLPQNLSFCCGNVLVEDIAQDLDLILSIRAFQNIETLDSQIRVVDRLHDMLAANGFLFFIESYVDGYEQLNLDRAHIGLPALPIHSHLTLLTEAFDERLGKIMDCVEKGSPSSVYYLITRLVYSKLASLNNESIDYDHPLHRLAAVVPQIGEYGPQRSGLFKKRAAV
jgi:SAM-dependent methyltransferase